MTRLPWTLLWHITFELIKLLVVTTGVLVLVLSFSACVKFLADGKLAPSDIPTFMSYMVLPMLAYALPFASCFASTLVYYRLATDNEAQAAAAGGVSHRTLLLPAAIVGLGLALTLGVLNEQVIPRFWRGVQQLITLDVARMLVNSVRNGESLAIGNRWVYAKEAWPVPQTTPGKQIFALQNAVVVEFDQSGEPAMQATAEWVQVLLTRADGPDGSAVTNVQCVATKLLGRDRNRALMGSEEIEFSEFIPDAFEDDPKFLTFGELRRLRNRPENLNFIDRRRRTLALETARLRVIDDLQRQAATSGRIELYEAGSNVDGRVGVGAGAAADPARSGRIVSIATSGLERAGPPNTYRIKPPSGQTTLTLLRGADGDARGSGGAMRVQAAEMTLLASPANEVAGAALTFRIQMPEGRMFALTADGREEEQGVRKSWTLTGLAPRAATLEELQKLNVPDLLRSAASVAGETRGNPAAVTNASADLRDKERDLQNEVTSKQHERMAQAACCFIMIITGAVVALRLALRQPLTVYLWSFLPALVCYITIAGGQQTTHSSGAIGLPLLWAGVAGLAGYTLLSFRTVARH